MNPNLLQSQDRKIVLAAIRSPENIKRKSEAFADYEIFNDRLLPYVRDSITKQLGDQAAKQIPIVSTLNVGKYVVENEATIYTTAPERELNNASEKDQETFESLYEKMKIDSRLQKTNYWYKYRGQSMLYEIGRAHV